MIPPEMADIIRDIYFRLAEHDRRFAGSEGTGLVTEVNAEEGWARVDIGPDPVTGTPMLSPKMPWEEPAMGAIKAHIPPKVGEQVRWRSSSGDIADARIVVGSVPSDANKRPHDKAGEMKWTLEDKWSQLLEASGTQTETHEGDYRRDTGGKYDLNVAAEITIDSDGITYINCG